MAFSCALIGDEWLLAQCAELLLEQGHSISAVVTSNQQIETWARERSLVVRTWNESLPAALDEISFEWLFSIANLRIVPTAIIAKASRGAINFHDGPLPQAAGLNTPSWAIIECQRHHGITWHAMTDGIDEGGIYARRNFAIEPDDTALTLNTRCFEAAVESFTELIGKISSDSQEALPQDFDTRRYYPKAKRPTGAGIIRFDQNAGKISALVRGLNFGPGYNNPLVTAKISTDQGIFQVVSCSVLGPTSALPGTVLSCSGDSVVIATADCALQCRAVRQTSKGEILLSDMIRPADRITVADDETLARIDTFVADVVAHEDWFCRKIRNAQDLKLAEVREISPGMEYGSLEIELPDALPGDEAIAVLSGFLFRLGDQERFTIALRTLQLSSLGDLRDYFSDRIPFDVTSQPEATVRQFTSLIASDLAALRLRKSYLADLPLRYPDTAQLRLSVGIAEVDRIDRSAVIDGCALTFALQPSTGRITLFYDRARYSDDAATALVRHFRVFNAAFGDSEARLGSLPMMDEQERNLLLYEWNDSVIDLDGEACVHTLFEAQVKACPQATALVCGDHSLTYAQLNTQANMYARTILEMGIVPDDIVGVYLPRSIETVAVMLAIQKSGGGYLPLDPDFPVERLKFMIDDSAAKIVISDRLHAKQLGSIGTTVLCVEEMQFAGTDPGDLRSPVNSSNLAYVIYTSGSTGRPKGVMVEHRNAINFFIGMDSRIGYSRETQPTWLAVTSISFDISVLELLWTLARGFKVILYRGGSRRSPAVSSPVHRQTAFGLFFWGNDDTATDNKYGLLLDSARFADTAGFEAIWIPERHFHAFGGPYPNPAVVGAALATTTQNLSIRAGSCVLPLHHPARVAEEWSVVDNLSGGRVGIAFASGWMPEDFVLRPENRPPQNKSTLMRDIALVQKLWRGETVEFVLGDAQQISLRTQPRPVQVELPIWITTAGNPDTYRDAARIGANVLTHLLGQSIDELKQKISIYRHELAQNGRNPADHKVTLMLHTFLGQDREVVKATVRGPMKQYLKSAASLIKQYAWAFPSFKKPQGIDNPLDIDLQSLDADEFDAILEFSFLRYFEESGLFGTLDDGLARIDDVAAAGVDEIACLIDFGIQGDLVLEALRPLADAVALRTTPHTAEQVPVYRDFCEEVTRHGVTHLQCTPSMARMFLLDDDNRAALSTIEHMFVGGEAFPASLLKELRGLTPAIITNMYGPTETTVWSSTAVGEITEGVVPLGKPIANTQLYVLDKHRQPVAIGQAGELYIGGNGVTRGYINQPDLTAEKFCRNPFVPGRIYKTGDLVRYDNDGKLNFLGRVDHQVKVRGYRIELGEIEANIELFPEILEAVVIAREHQSQDVRLVAYVRVNDARLDREGLKTFLQTMMPEYMVPTAFVQMEKFPLTPNSKVDRGALPPIAVGEAPKIRSAYTAPKNDIQRDIAQIFEQVLGIRPVGVTDNFFALGGHSLLAVQAHRLIKAISPSSTITDLFRFPVVSDLADHLGNREKADEQLTKIADRAAMRRSAMGARRTTFARLDG